LRQGEALGLRWQDVDLDAGVLRVRHALQAIDDQLMLDVLGHSAITLTLNTYSHVVPALQTEAARRMDAALGWRIDGSGTRIDHESEGGAAVGTGRAIERRTGL
jgi:hypothetical protein